MAVGYNPYDVLGVNPLSSMDEIKRKYRELCKRYHPDLVSGDADKFEEVSKAYDYLKKYHGVGSKGRGVWKHKSVFTVKKEEK